MTQELLQKLSELNNDSKDVLEKLTLFNNSFDKISENFSNMEAVLAQVKKAFDLYKEVNVLLSKEE